MKHSFLPGRVGSHGSGALPAGGEKQQTRCEGRLMPMGRTAGVGEGAKPTALYFFQSKGFETGSISACCRDCKTAKKILHCTGGDVRGQRKSMAWPEAQEWFVPTALVRFCGIYFLSPCLWVIARSKEHMVMIWCLLICN